MHRNILFFVYIICFAFSLLACRIDNSSPVFTLGVKNKDSKLLNELIQVNDFDKSNYKIDNIQFFQKDMQGEVLEEASIWVVAFHLPENEYFQISHRLLLINKNASVNQDGFYVFEQENGNLFDLGSDIKNVDSVKCSRYDSFQECLFVKKYDNVISVLSVVVRNSVDHDLMAQWVQPFLEKIEKRLKK
ncbi:MAG: hypothetical protein U0Z26_10120 [Anaerolineales bacterium]